MEASKFWCNFFRILVLFFQKIGKNTKNCKNSKKIKNEAGVMYCLIYIFFRFYFWRFDFQKNIFPIIGKCSAILLVGYIFRYTTAMLKTQVTVVVQHCNSGIACYCYWYNTAVLVTQSQMELYSMMYQGLANLDVKPIWSRNVMIWYSDGTTKK